MFDSLDEFLGVLGIAGLELGDLEEILLPCVTLVLNELHKGFLIHFSELSSHSVPI